MCNGLPIAPIEGKSLTTWEEDLTAFEEIADNISETDTIPYDSNDDDIDMYWGPKYSITEEFYPERNKHDLYIMLQDPTLEIPSVLHLWNDYILDYDADIRNIKTVACQNCRQEEGVGYTYKSYHILQTKEIFIKQIHQDMEYDLGTYFCGNCNDFLLHVDDAYNPDLNFPCCSDDIHSYFVMDSDIDSIISLM